nr:hypothetical protein MarFTME_040 [Marseillevirus futianmevirus]
MGHFFLFQNPFSKQPEKQQLQSVFSFHKKTISITEETKNKPHLLDEVNKHIFSK